ncbi:hypothetical protein DL95DRAFT_487489 [Leptodontidium sp. 2 PMI_412]|nr:hypothetical protein DL95DRAFT_487489 [Leptodontidium sp. 2 PMI_412]
MTRITPRTCLWPLAGSLSLTFGLSIGLTYRSDQHCYAGTCGEWLFPLQARLHVVVWYCWLGISVTVLAVRAFHLYDAEVSPTRPPWQQNSFLQKATLSKLSLGLTLDPLSLRHSDRNLVGSLATTLTFHMITAYTLFALVLTHGLLYVFWIPALEALPAALRKVYPVLNPTCLYDETWLRNTSSMGIWRASLIFTGSVATFIMALIFITTLPAVRNRHFNLFYYHDAD